MFKRLYNKQAQATMGEYVLVFFIVMGVMATIMVYFKRAVQARMYDVRANMGAMVQRRAGQLYNYNVPVYLSYEPYYMKTNATIDHDYFQNEVLSSPNIFHPSQTGLYIKNFNEITTVDSASETRPPREAQWLP